MLRKLNIYAYKSLLGNPRFISFFFHFLFTTLGVSYKRWYFTLNLFLITNLSTTITYILKSIFQHFGKLLITLLMTILLIFSYTFILLTNFTGEINTGDFGDFVCKDFKNCFFNAMNHGMRMGGGLSDFLVLIASPDGANYWGRFFFDITYFIMI